MSADDEIIELEGVDPAWLSTPEGRQKAERIFSRNADKLQLRYFQGDVPRGYVKLQQVYPNRIEGTVTCPPKTSPTIS